MGISIEQIDFVDLSSSNPKLKYGCARNLLAIAKDSPAELYPHIDDLAKLLGGGNRILKWTAIDIVGLLSKVDTEQKIDKIMGKLFKLLNRGNMITANHAIVALANIALTKPEYQGNVTRELLAVERYNYETVECHNIVLGKAILAIGVYFDRLEDKRMVTDFVERQTNNTRSATRKKAEQFLKKLNK
ncbi:MAG: hypothetical protein HY665_06480 [Chloroflexi bacterium]|nr:hypothetical protein [Chloroflexota bacterium]